MLLVRPSTLKDHDEIQSLARLAGTGMTSLPQDPDVMRKKIERSVASFTGKLEHMYDESFLFVCEDTDTKKLIGTAGVVAHVGMRRPFYSYKLSTILQAAPHLDIVSNQRVLHMVNDYTGATELGSLFVIPEYRKDGIGRFLSRCRYLMLAEFGAVFDERVISEIRGVQDSQGNSPFYEHLARHFFQMDFPRADFITATQGTQFIADLMPKYPIYVTLLPQEARDVIGEPFEASKPAKHLLEQEGFRWQGYVDIFDAGPTMQADRSQIRTVANSAVCSIESVEAKIPQGGTKVMLATRTLEQFRMTWATVGGSGQSIVIDKETAAMLGVKAGDSLRVAE